MITIVAAAAQNNALGKDNQLIWHLSDDLKRFKSLTLDGYIIMGRKAFKQVPHDKDAFVVGGGEIYRQAITIADKIELTRVHHDFEADTFFPEIDLTQWKLVSSEFHPKDEKHQYDFTFETYLRNK